MRKWSKEIMGVAAACVLGLAGVAAAQQPCGDVNGSGAVDPGDAVRLNLAALNFPPQTAGDCKNNGTLQCGDLFSDGSIDVGDLVILLNRLAGNDTTFFCSNAGAAVACNTTVSGNITSNVTWPDCTGVGDGTSVKLSGAVLVEDGAVVTVAPGAIVKGIKNAANPSVLVVKRGGKLNAPGTAAKPIVFTSDQGVGAHARQDWGGVVLNGRAPNNFDGGVGSSEGFPLGAVLFGGNLPNDSSGTLRFARIEHSGVVFSDDNELNVLTMNSLGRGTTMDHVQANNGSDDCLEWFGGTIRSKFMVGTNCEDDHMDWQIGFTGAIQYGLVYMNGSVGGDRAIEADNNEFGEDNIPRSDPHMCNLTLIGSKDQGTPSGNDAMRLRRGTLGKIYNSIFTDWVSNAVEVDAGGSTCSIAGGLEVCNSISNNTGSAACTSDCAAGAGSCASFTSCGLTTANPGMGVLSTFPGSVDDRYFPASPGPAAGVAACPWEPDFFDATTYAGAFVPGGSTGSGDNWLVTTGGWISFLTN